VHVGVGNLEVSPKVGVGQELRVLGRSREFGVNQEGEQKLKVKVSQKRE
jgi:hypothetical protein